MAGGFSGGVCDSVKAAGGGKITGVFGAPRIELAANLPSIGLPDMTLKAARLDLVFAQGKAASDGTVALTGRSDYGPAAIRSAFRFLRDGLDLTGFDADAGGVKAKMQELSQFFPAGMKVVYPYDTTPFVKVAIHEVYKTLIEAIVLVFLVMYLFMGNLRATLIPTIAVPVVILGTFGVYYGTQPLWRAFGLPLSAPAKCPRCSRRG